MPTTIKLKNGSGAPTAGQLVQGEVALDLTNKRIYSENSGGTVLEMGTNPAAEITANAGIALPDNQKVTFGASDDLQIYHDPATGSYISELGAGSLFIQTNNNGVVIEKSDGTDLAYFDAVNSRVALYNGGATKLLTTSTGIDVTGTVVADGLTVDNNTGTPVVINRNQAVDGYGLVLNQADSTDGNSLEINYQTTTTGTVTPNTLMAGIAFEAQTHDFNTRKGNIFLRTAEGGVGYKDRVKVGYNGDISFYEDTGTTAKFFWDASAESLGIGTNSQTSTLEVTGSRTAFWAGRFENTSATGYGVLAITASSSASQTALEARTGTSNTAFIVRGDGNVGIGTSSPVDELHVAASSTPRIRIDATTTGQNANLLLINSADSLYAQIENEGSALKFLTQATERARIDSSGNLLVGQSSTTFPGVGNTTTGFGINANGTFCASKSSGTTVYINRNTTDGTLATFAKDGVSVGSIGSLSNHLYVGNDDTALRFISSLNAICPANAATPAGSDALLDLGRSTERFKDLYLSGGVYLGGTGAANHLDDYETGTFTPTAKGLTTAGTGTYAFQYGHYVKVGDMVTVDVYLRVSTHTGTGVLAIAGLPFTVLNSTGNYASIDIGEAVNLTTSADHTLTGYTIINTDYVRIRQIPTAATKTGSDVSMDTAFDLMFSVTYRTA